MKKSAGAVLILMLAILLTAMTTAAITRLSLNRNSTERAMVTAKALKDAREALLGYALRTHQFAGNDLPLGTLPCPSTDGDGESNVSATGLCVSQRGLFPFQTLGLPELLDGSGNNLWYAVALEYTGPPGATLRNSSLLPTLRLDNLPMAAVILAPEREVHLQQRTLSNPVLAAPQYLEGENANNTLGTYSARLQDDENNSATNQNDMVASISAADFWGMIETVVALRVVENLQDYRATCAGYPGAVPSTTSDTAGIPGRRFGFVPLNLVVCDGSTTPVINNLPQLIRTHWARMFYYEFCNPAIPCLELGDGPPNDATAILLAPGIPILEQNRTGTPPLLTHFFELENATENDQIFSPTNPGVVNDTQFIITP